jgi:hypothetical protein
MQFVDMLYDYQVAMGFTPTGIHFPFCGNLVSLHFCIFSVYIVVECRSGANKYKNKRAVMKRYGNKMPTN